MAVTLTSDFEVMQGTDASVVFTLKDTLGAVYDLTDHTARLHVRSSFGSSTILIDADTTLGNLVIDDTLGKIIWYIDNTDTTAIRFNDAENEESIDLVYNLEIIDIAGKVSCPARGTITVYREVTR
jgi:hypothetical protein